MAKKTDTDNQVTDFEWAKAQMAAGKKVALPWYAEGVFYDSITEDTVFGETEINSTEWLVVE